MSKTPEWGVRSATEADLETLRQIAGGEPRGSGKSGARTLVLDVEGVVVGFVVFRAWGSRSRIEDLRLFPKWQLRGIENEVAARLRNWAKRRRHDFRIAPSVVIPQRAGWERVNALPKELEEQFLPVSVGNAFLLYVLGFAIFLATIWIGPLGRDLPPASRWFRPEPLYFGMMIGVFVPLWFGFPHFLFELRGRFAGGRVLVDLGPNPYRGWWCAAATGFLLIALAFLVATGAGVFPRLFLFLTAVCGLFALRRGAIRERGVHSPDRLGFVPFSAVDTFWVEDGRAVLPLGSPGDSIRCFHFRVSPADEAEISRVLASNVTGEPPAQVVPVKASSGSDRWWPILVMFIVMVVPRYYNDMPSERPPGPVAFQISSVDKTLLIGRETDVTLFPSLLDPETGYRIDLDGEQIDLATERIELVLEARDREGRPVRSVSAATGCG